MVTEKNAQNRSVKKTVRDIRRRSAIEPVIGHMKNRTGRGSYATLLGNEHYHSSNSRFKPK